MLLQILFSLLLSFSVSAAHLDTVCESAISNPPLFSTGLVARNMSAQNSVLEKTDGSLIYQDSSKFRAVETIGNKIWLLTTDNILELTSEGTLLESHSMPMSRSMTVAGDLLLVVRSGGVVSAFDYQTKKIAWTSYMQDVPGGKAVAIAYDGEHAYLAVTNTRESGFTGVVVINPATGDVLKKASYDVRRVGIIAPMAFARWHQDKLIINNLGWIHVITKKQILSGKTLRPKWVAHVMSRDSDPHYMMLKGDFLMEGNSLVACGSFRELIGSERNPKSALFKIQIP